MPISDWGDLIIKPSPAVALYKRIEDIFKPNKIPLKLIKQFVIDVHSIK